MSITGCYELHLACDFLGRNDLGFEACTSRAQTIKAPETAHEAYTEMRSRGWMVNPKKGVCYCPRHNYDKKLRDARAKK